MKHVFQDVDLKIKISEMLGDGSPPFFGAHIFQDHGDAHPSRLSKSTKFHNEWPTAISFRKHANQCATQSANRCRKQKETPACKVPSNTS